MTEFEHDFSEEARPLPAGKDISGEGADLRTLSIDLNNLFSGEVWETGSFNLRGIETSSLGKLLDALPIPALLVDKYHCVVYSNNQWTKLDGDVPRACGMSFMDLIACSDDSERAQKILAQAAGALEQAFQTRKRAKVEAILQTGGGKKWSRLHLQSVRIASRRYLLTLIEDITVERTRERLGRMEEQRLRRLCRELQQEVGALKAQLGETNRGEISLKAGAL